MKELLNNIKETKLLNLGGVVGRFLLKLPMNVYLLRPHKSDRSFLWNRSKIFLDSHFGEEALIENGGVNMTNRMIGFEQGYEACLEDLGIKLTYTKKTKSK